MTDEEYLAALQQIRLRSGRRPEALNQSRGVNMPLQLARGWAAGTAGLPGDIESLARMLPLPTRGGLARASEQTVLPTSEEILPRIPGQDESPAGRFFSGAGTMAGGAGLTKIARGVNRAADVVGNRAVQAITGNPQATALGVLQEAGQLSPLAAIVKPKGGNWLSDSVERAVEPLKRNVGDMPLSELERGWAEMGLSNSPAAAEIRAQRTSDETINKWLDQKLTRYIRNEMGTPEDPVRALAERNVLHVSPEQLNYRLEAHGKYPLPEQQFLAKSEAAKVWEGASDNAINVTRPSEYLRYMGDAEYDRTLKENPWMLKVPPETKVYSTAESEMLADDLGFNHLIDELRNAMNPESGLPRALQLTPDKLEKVTVPQAVELVDKINKWRAEQKAAANAARANNAAAVPYREYPTVPGTELPNERGLRWVELKAPESDVSDIKFEKVADGVRAFDAEGNRLVSPGGYNVFANEEQALMQLRNERARKPLEDALKYEGDVMGHCVGGYCPDVMEGRSRIFSLRDAKGEPHVTVEVKPPTNQETVFLGDPRLRGNFSDEEAQLMEKVYGDITQMPEELGARVRRLIGADVPEIVQIKGKANRAPKEEYLPFVQDFVRSQKWGRIGDVQNTGMRPTREVFNFNELQKLKQLGEDYISDALSGEEIQRLHNLIVPQGQRLKYDARGNVVGSESANYSKGGVVKSLVEAVEKYLGREAAETAAAAAVKEAPKEQRMLQGFYRGYAGDYDAAKAAEDAGMVFVSPQRAAGEFYANKRAAQTGLDPHLEMILADPFAGYAYGHNIPLGPQNRKIDFTKARQLQPEQVKSRTKLYAEGGSVQFDSDEIAHLAGQFTSQFTPGYAAGGTVKYDPSEIEQLVAQMREEFHA